MAGILLTYLLLAVATAWTYMPWCDEAWFSGPALALLTRGHMGTPVLDPTAEWHGRKLAGIGEYTYWIMPLYPFSQTLWFRLAPFGLLTLRLYSVFWGLLALLAWWAILRKLSDDEGVALMGVAFIAIDFTVLWSAGVGRMDMMCAALGAAGIAAYLWLRERNLPAAILLSQSAIVAAGLAHPMALGACAGLAAVAIYLDRRRFHIRHVALAVIPYLLGAAAWGLYIAKNPALFWAQFSGNATGRLVSGPLLNWLRKQTVERFLYIFGFAPETHGLGHVKLLVLVAYMAGIAGALATRQVRAHKGYRALLLLSAISSIVIMALDREVQSFYMLYFTMPMAAILAVWIRTGWRERSTPRWALTGVVVVVTAIQLGVDLLHIRQDPYHQEYLSSAEFLKRHVQPGEAVFGSAELAFELGFDGRLTDDYRLGYKTGRQAEFLVLDKQRYMEWIEELKDAEPQAYRYIQQLLSTKYQLVEKNAAYQILQRRDAIATAATAQP